MGASGLQPSPKSGSACTACVLCSCAELKGFNEIFYSKRLEVSCTYTLAIVYNIIITGPGPFSTETLPGRIRVTTIIGFRHAIVFSTLFGGYARKIPLQSDLTRMKIAPNTFCVPPKSTETA